MKEIFHLLIKIFTIFLIFNQEGWAGPYETAMEGLCGDLPCGNSTKGGGLVLFAIIFLSLVLGSKKTFVTVIIWLSIPIVLAGLFSPFFLFALYVSWLPAFVIADIIFPVKKDGSSLAEQKNELPPITTCSLDAKKTESSKTRDQCVTLISNKYSGELIFQLRNKGWDVSTDGTSWRLSKPGASYVFFSWQDFTTFAKSEMSNPVD